MEWNHECVSETEKEVLGVGILIFGGLSNFYTNF